MLEKKDQAASLRAKHATNNKEVKLQTVTLSITSGKGGVGKTSVSINLSHALSNLGKKVLLVDCDFGLANIDILLNLEVKNTLEEVLENKIAVEQAVVRTNYGFDVLPASSGVSAIADMDINNQKHLIHELAKLQSQYDFMIFDTGAGIHKTVLRINASADTVIVITNAEPSSITDAYSMIKAMRNLYKVQHFSLLANQVKDAQGKQLFNLINNVAKTHGVFIQLEFLGSLPKDDTVVRSIFQRVPWQTTNRYSPALQAVQKIAQQISRTESVENLPKDDSYRFWRKWVVFGQKNSNDKTD